MHFINSINLSNSSGQIHLYRLNHKSEKTILLHGRTEATKRIENREEQYAIDGCWKFVYVCRWSDYIIRRLATAVVCMYITLSSSSFTERWSGIGGSDNWICHFASIELLFCCGLVSQIAVFLRLFDLWRSLRMRRRRRSRRRIDHRRRSLKMIDHRIDGWLLEKKEISLY
jgi:hypothetical protein